MANSKNKTTHPKTQTVKFIMPDGSFLMTRSTYSKSSEFNCERSYKEHPAWNKEKVSSMVNKNSEKITKFNNKFGSFNNMFGSKQ